MTDTKTLQVGTLKDLNVQVGDKVEYMGFNIRREYTVKEVDGVLKAVRDVGIGSQLVRYSFDPSWRLISRAEPQYKTWGDMTDAEKGELLLAHHEGKIIEVARIPDFDNCITIRKPSWDTSLYYRVKPEPVVETVVVSAHVDKVDGSYDWSTLRKMDSYD